MIMECGGENLGLVFEPSKRRAFHDAVAVKLKGTA
jgi:hypothetical protein